MNRFVRLAVVGVSLAFTGCASAVSQNDVQSQIMRLDAEWSRAAQARDVDRVVAFWADDAIVFPPGSPAVVGKSAIREFVAKSFQTPGFSISWKTTTVAVSRSGDIAYTTGTNRVTVSAADGKQVAVEGKAVAVWRRENGGAWSALSTSGTICRLRSKRESGSPRRGGLTQTERLQEAHRCLTRRLERSNGPTRRSSNEPVTPSLGPSSRRLQEGEDRRMDEDLDRMSRDELVAEAKKLRQGIRKHRDSTRHELCWHHPALWGLLPEKSDPVPVVPDWPQFILGCVKYRQSLDAQAPDAPRTAEPYPR